MRQVYLRRLAVIRLLRVICPAFPPELRANMRCVNEITMTDAPRDRAPHCKSVSDLLP